METLNLYLLHSFISGVALAALTGYLSLKYLWASQHTTGAYMRVFEAILAYGHPGFSLIVQQADP
jgi:hypothetical protein